MHQTTHEVCKHTQGAPCPARYQWAQGQAHGGWGGLGAGGTYPRLLFVTTGGNVSTDTAEEKSAYATCRVTRAPSHSVSARKGCFYMRDLTILENEKEEEKGAKVQLKREKSQEDKPAFKKEEVNITGKSPH